MPLFFSSILFLLREFLLIPFDVVRGIRRRRYALSYDVDAPKDVTWSVVSAHKIRLEGSPPLDMDTEPDPNRPGVYTGFCRSPTRSYAFAYRILDERPGEALTLAIIPEESDPVYHFGENYVGAVAVTGDASGSTITGSYDLTHTRFMTRWVIPLALVQSRSRLKRTAEHRAGTLGSRKAEQIKNAALTGVLTFASFFALYGPSMAAIFIFLILIHEFGHVIAMRWAGIPVLGIYFVPFFGGVAVGDSVAQTQAARGLVALMGPGFSVVTTALFLVLDAQSPGGLMRELAMMSALLNGFNLLPIMPLDGGHVVQSLLSRAGEDAARTFRVVALFAGCTLAFWAGDYLLLSLLLLLAPGLVKRQTGTALQVPPLSVRDLMLLACAYAAVFAFYAVTIARLWGTPVPGTG